MAPRAPRKRQRRTSEPRRRRRFPALALGLLIGTGLMAGALAAWHGWPPAHTPPEVSTSSRRPGPSTTKPAPPPPRVRPKPPRENPEGSQSPAVAPAPGLTGMPAEHPRVAVIFDDAGYSLRTAREVMALPRPVTISVLPALPFSTPIAEEAAARGVQVILHLPVQPDNPSLDVGPGGVTVGMSDAAIAQTVSSDFATVPGAVGTNNHMGSRGTADPRVMRAILGVVKTRRLFFIDSLTSPRSVAAATARTMGVPTAVRAVFLDNENNDSYVRAQLHALIRAAQTRGQAIAIGHVGKVTARVLRDMLPEFDEAGIRFVPASALVR